MGELVRCWVISTQSTILIIVGVACRRQSIRDRSDAIGCTIVKTGINYRHEETIPPGELLRANLDVQTSTSTTDNKTTTSYSYRVRIVTLTRTTFLDSASTSDYYEPAENVHRINHFIKTPALKRLEIVRDHRLQVYCIGTVLSICGVLALLGKIWRN